MKKVALHNLGCKVNAYETEAVGQLLTEKGYEIVPFDTKADIYIVNTCTVTNIADRKSRQMLHKAKKTNPQALVIAMGCYAQVSGQEAVKDESIDLIIGNNKKHELISALEAYEAGASKTLDGMTMEDIAHTAEYERMHLTRMAEHTRAYIKIQDGCNQFCSYCIIPYARGRVRSRSEQDIVEEVTALAQNGYREIVLTGIHISSYGADIKSSESSLLSLTQRVHRVDGIERIRLGSLEPRIVTEEFTAALAKLPKVCPHFHLSLQSGCDTVLKRMNRHYTCQEYYDNVKRLRRHFQSPAITTDIIVGFPGETEEEFEETCRFVERVEFYETHVFKYSRRNGTPAAAMDSQLTERVKAARSARLLEMSRRSGRRFQERFLDRPIEVLWEEIAQIDGRSCLTGHTREYIRAAAEAGGRMPGQVESGWARGFLTEEILEFSGNME